MSDFFSTAMEDGSEKTYFWGAMFTKRLSKQMTWTTPSYKLVAFITGPEKGKQLYP